MVVRLPGPDEPASFGPPIVAPVTDNASNLPEGAKAVLVRMQARDDALFVASALAELTARQRAAALAAKNAAQTAGDRPVEGYARRLDAEFAADVKRTIKETQSLSGPRPPSGEAIDLLRRRAESVQRSALARNAVVEDELLRAAQQRRLEGAIDGLEAVVSAEPEALDEALGRLSDLTGAAAGLIGVKPAAALDREAGVRLAAAAAQGMIARDPAEGLAAIQRGAFDDRLDDATRKRLSHEAALLSQAAARDAAVLQRNQAAETSRREEARALAFAGTFRRRLATGEAGHAEIAAALAEGELTQAHADALSAALDESLAVRSAVEGELLRVGAAIQDGRRLDAAKPKDCEAAASYFDLAIAPVLADLSSRQRIDAITDYAGATRIVPENGLRMLAGMVMAGAAGDRVQAAQALTGLAQWNTLPEDVLPAGILRLTGDLAKLASFGIPPENAVSLAENGPHYFIAGENSIDQGRNSG